MELSQIKTLPNENFSTEELALVSNLKVYQSSVKFENVLLKEMEFLKNRQNGGWNFKKFHEVHEISLSKTMTTLAPYQWQSSGRNWPCYMWFNVCPKQSPEQTWSTDQLGQDSGWILEGQDPGKKYQEFWIDIVLLQFNSSVLSSLTW